MTIEPKEISLPAPCKVNLTLDVFPPRPDGYHDLDSIVAVAEGPADQIKVSIRPGVRRILFICKDKSLPKDDSNLAVRAARLFLEEYLPEMDATVYIKLEKFLPVQAGMGGGSSDAATVLRTMALLFEGQVAADLPPLAARIGSDVSLFLIGGRVRMRGRGEIVEAVSGSLPQHPLYGVIIKPAVGVPTGPAYALLDGLPKRQPGNATSRLLSLLKSGAGVEEIGAAMGNDFEAAILSHYPEVAEVHQAIQKAGAVRALLCGSGAAVFGLARNRDHARELIKNLCGRFPYVKLATGL